MCKKQLVSMKMPIKTLCANYIDNIKAHTQKEKIRNRYSNQLEDADERFMRSIEEKIDIAESRKDDFRREMNELYWSISY